MSLNMDNGKVLSWFAFSCCYWTLTKSNPREERAYLLSWALSVREARQTKVLIGLLLLTFSATPPMMQSLLMDSKKRIMLTRRCVQDNSKKCVHIYFIVCICPSWLKKFIQHFFSLVMSFVIHIPGSKNNR